MLLVSVGFSRPIEIIRSLGISRQALNVTIKSLKQRGLIKTKTDPNDKRCKIILFADSGKHSRDNDFEVLMALVRELETRLGTKTMDGLYRGLEVEWG